MKETYKGFTLVELLVVMAIIGVLATLIVGGFRSSQMRGRDAARKGDLKEITNALEIFYSDYGKYPPASGTQIAGCSYNPATGAGAACIWGRSEFTDGKTTYFKVIPKDPSTGQSYIYKVDSTKKKYQLYAHLENTQDKNCIGGDCVNPGITDNCGGANLCNFSITSPNTTPTETLN
jgi:general secretion pathway protein G